MRLVTLIGTGSYGETDYRLGKESVRTPFVALALARVLHPTDIVILTTPTAAAGATLAGLEAALAAGGFASRREPIPEQAGDSDLWKMFEVVGRLGTDGAQVSLDVTHGYRFLPLVAALAASYFQSLGGLNLVGLYYGAYSGPDAESPILDLRRMLSLPGWAQAARAWRDHGDAEPLVQLTRAASAEAWGRGDGSRPVALNALAGSLDAFGEQIRLARHDVRRAADRVSRNLARASSDMDQHVPPLRELLAETGATLPGLCQPGVAGDIALIELQRRARRLLPATLLARELVVTIWQQQRGLASRSEAERELGELSVQRDGRLPGALWGDLGDLRNDLGHCGWRENPRDPRRAEAQFDGLWAGVRAWAASLRNGEAGAAES